MMNATNSSATEDLDNIFHNQPRYFQQGWLHFGLLIGLEYLTLCLQGKPRPRFCDTFTSLSLGAVQECAKVLSRGLEMYLYITIYEKYRLLDLTLDPIMTWYFTVVLVDFGYYWLHRASHEINVLWAQHQVHHSSDDFNLAVGLRHGFLNPWISAFIYLPLALIVPPAQFVAHQQFNLLYQFWVHTETVETLGPLEWILNTPNHHRVHHGCNKYLIDTNYGGVFIIWDRLFGTFQRKLPEETVYGLVYPPERFNLITLQTYYFQGLSQRFRNEKGWNNKLGTIFKGPSWVPGSPWTGYHELRPEIHTRPKFSTQISTWKQIYLAIHFIVTLKGFQDVCQTDDKWAATLFSLFVVFSLSNFGFILENKPWAPLLELGRCLFFVAVIQFNLFTLPTTGFKYLVTYLKVSVLIWMAYSVMQSTAPATGKQKRS